MTITINGTDGITTPEVTLDNTSADGGQVVLKSFGYSNWNLDNYSGRFRGYYGSTEYFTVDASGNMGIGTSSPAVKLHTTGTTNELARFNASSTGTGYVLITQNNSTGEGLKLSYTNSNGSASIGTVYSAELKFLTGDTERARIDSSGNLLVGCTTSPSSGASYGCFINPRYAQIKTDTTSTYGVWEFFNPNGSVGKINTSGSSTAYVTSSDYRLKNTVTPMTGALAKISALKPVTYKWNTDDSDGQGFIAHELQEVVPECVVGEKDAVDAEGNPVYQGIDTSFLVATLTAAIQELKAIVDEQAAKITALENK